MSDSATTVPAAALNGTPAPESNGTIAKRAHYAPPWADVSIIGIAGSSGSGKSTLSHAIVNKLNLPWVVILSIVSHGLSGMEQANPGLLVFMARRTPFTKAWTRNLRGRHSGMNTTLMHQT
jgi:hypothetical protein